MSQELSNLSRAEIKRRIHNLKQKHWRLIQDANWAEQERLRKRISYSNNSKNRIASQTKWNKANRVKTREYNKKCYEKHKPRILEYQHEYYAKNKKKILAARKEKYGSN